MERPTGSLFALFIKMLNTEIRIIKKVISFFAVMRCSRDIPMRPKLPYMGAAISVSKHYDCTTNSVSFKTEWQALRTQYSGFGKSYASITPWLSHRRTSVDWL